MYSCNCEIEDLNNFKNSVVVLAVALQAVCTIFVDRKYRAVHFSVLY
jgi:hypothetical protein